MPPKYPCLICRKDVRTNSYAIECNTCKRWCHLACIRDPLFTEERYFDMSTSDDSWKCEVYSTINISEISATKFESTLLEELNNTNGKYFY